jgi:hypothetical protein
MAGFVQKAVAVSVRSDEDIRDEAGGDVVEKGGEDPHGAGESSKTRTMKTTLTERRYIALRGYFSPPAHRRACSLARVC